jgi:hypothetical protein
VNAKTARSVVVGVLCILALSVAAATLEDPASTGAPGGPAGDQYAGNLTPSNATATPQPPARETRQGDRTRSLLKPVFCIPALRDPAVLLGILGVVLGATLALYWKNDFAWSVVTVTVAGLGPAVFLVLALSFTLSGCEPPSREASTNGSAPPPAGTGTPGAGGEGTEAVAPAAPDTALVVVGVVAVAVVAALAVIVRGTGDDDATPDEDDDGGALAAASAIAGVARTAGEAADRIEASGEVDNEVYRAWREMTTHLDTDRPASSTPAEFREAAVDAGMDPRHVGDLTDLFEAVRYGGREPTGDRERRAVEALRAIEDAYGGERR